MSQPQVNKIRIANPPIEGEVRTYLTIDCLLEATTITSLDNTGFVLSGDNDYYIIIGEYAQEKADILLVDASDAATAETSFKVSATKYSHEASDPVTFIRYNQIKFYGMETATSSKVLLETKDIDCSQTFTEYVYQGDTYNYFCSAYYNSNDDELSAYSDIIENNSYTRKSIKRIIDSGLTKALTKLDEGNDPELSMDIAVSIVQDGIDEIMTRKRKWAFLETTSNISTVANQEYIEFPTDLSLLKFITIDNVKLQFISPYQYNSYYIDDNLSKGTPTHYTIKNNKVYLFPTPDQVFTVSLEYYKTITEITSDLSTQIDLPFVPILIYYCAAQFAYIRGNDKRGDKMYQLFVKLLEEQVVEYSGPEQFGDSERAEFTQPYSDDYII